MSNDAQKSHGSLNRSKWENGLRSFRTISRIVSSGASTVSRTVRSAASLIVDKEEETISHNQVRWAGFDKLECVGNITRKVLLLGYLSGFQVWDVEDSDNVRDLVSEHHGTVSFLQILPKLTSSNGEKNKFVEKRPLLVIGADESLSGNDNIINGHNNISNKTSMPIVVQFYSVRSRSYVHELKFRSVVYSVRCSSRVVAVAQAAQIHCFDAATLEREYTILTNPIVSGCVGYGPLAVGCRWLAYSGTQVILSNSGRVTPQNLASSFPNSTSNLTSVAHYAKESSKQIASGIVTLGDMGYKKLSRYYSELLPDDHSSIRSETPGLKVNGTNNGILPLAENVGMVIVRDIASKSVIAQFRAHKSPISALCFDPSGTLLLTASVQGHNINVFRIEPSASGTSNGHDSCIHLYRLQRGFTNAVIQDISFSDDSHWIMISSSRGTSHLFAIQSSESSFNTKSSGMNVISNDEVQLLNQCNAFTPAPPITLSALSRIRNGNNGWKGRPGPISGSIASSFQNFHSNGLKSKHHLLVFSPSGYIIQYKLRMLNGHDASMVKSGLNPDYDSAVESEKTLAVEPVQKWNVCQKQRDLEDNSDIYGQNGSYDISKVFPEGVENEQIFHPKEKSSPEDRHHLYISEAELQMHPVQIPLWAKSKIYFQAIIVDGIAGVENGFSGEDFEIERIPTRTIEGSSKDLIPVFDYLRRPNFQQTSSGSIDSLAEFQNGSEVKSGRNDIRIPRENTMHFVNNNLTPEAYARIKTVNNKENLKMDTRFKFVNSSNPEPVNGKQV